MQDPAVEAAAIAQRIAQLLLDKKASEVLILDVRGKTSYADYMVIASGESDRQVIAMAEGVVSGLKEEGAVLRCIAEGAEDYLPKPVDTVLLRARIQACLERRRWRERVPLGEVGSLAIDPRGSERLVVATPGGLAASSDGGARWRPPPPGARSCPRRVTRRRGRRRGPG